MIIFKEIVEKELKNLWKKNSQSKRIEIQFEFYFVFKNKIFLGLKLFLLIYIR